MTAARVCETTSVMSIDSLQRAFLLVMAASITPISLFYGLAPELTLTTVLGVEVSGVNTQHLFRAVMGLYLGMVSLWLVGALRPSMRITALWSLVVFAGGIAVGRFLSIVIDGWPSPLLTFFMLAEIGIVATGLFLIRADQEAR